jgi:hypothetical protein
MRCPGCRHSNTLPDSQPIGALQIPRIRSGRATPGPRNQSSTRSAIGLIKHAAAGERIWFQHYLSGLPEAECDGFAQRGEGSFAVSDDETLSDVIAEFERAGCRSRSIAEQYDLEHTVLRGQTVGTNLMFDPFLPWATLPPKTPSARPAAPPARTGFDDAIPRLARLLGRTVRDPVAALATSLACPHAEVATVLRKRGDHQIAALLDGDA